MWLILLEYMNNILRHLLYLFTVGQFNIKVCLPFRVFNLLTPFSQKSWYYRPKFIRMNIWHPKQSLANWLNWKIRLQLEFRWSLVWVNPTSVSVKNATWFNPLCPCFNLANGHWRWPMLAFEPMSSNDGNAGEPRRCAFHYKKWRVWPVATTWMWI